METPRQIVVVGASLAGLRACEALRGLGHDGKLVLVGAEARLPYDRPPLSKEILRGDWEPERVDLRREGYDDLAMEIELGRRVVLLDPVRRMLTLDDGRSLDYDGLVVATGAIPKKLPGLARIEGVHVLRTLDDSLALRSELLRAARVVVVGAGFIGAEVAASARQMGLEVVMVEPQPVPLAHALGLHIGEICGELHRAHGVDLRCGVGVEGFETDPSGDRFAAVRLTNGSRVEADVAVVGIGVRPATDWLEGSGVALSDGILCDSRCRASVPGVVAAGDVARWHNELFDETMRVEHWSNAVEQASAAAAALLHGDDAAPYRPVPSVWSDQHGVKIQTAGRIRAGDRMEIVQGDPAEFRFTALFGRDDRLSGVLTFRRPGQLIRYSELLERGASWDEAMELARSTRSAPPA